MVFKGSLYLLNILCGIIPCEYKYAYPETSDPLNSNLSQTELNGNSDSGKQDNYATQSLLLVNTTSGMVKGYWMKVVGGREIRAFEGIPYAQPPVDELRFKAPVPIKPWDKILSATLKGPKCLQYNDLTLSRIVGSENCLFLNIYSPQPRLEKNGTEVYPAVIYLHGGGFLTGSGNDFGPAYLLQRDMVLVTINFRLGVMGFMSTTDDISPGNYGLKDQAEAINWVSRNIEQFNGDKNAITLMGHGSGGASVHFQMISFKARGKFVAGISISGTSFNHWAMHTKNQALNLTKTFAKSLHCPIHGSTESIVTCLKKLRGFDLVKMQIPLLDIWPAPLSLFRPVLEEEYHKEDPFLTETPETAYQKGTVDKIPWICGQAEDEGYTFLLSHVALGTFGSLRQNWDSLAADFLNYNDLPIDQAEITRRVNWQYFRNISSATAPLRVFTDAVGTRLIYSGIHKALQAHSAHAETFAFMFGYKGKYNLATLAGIQSSNWGVGHGEILAYILNSTNTYTGFKRTDSEFDLSKILVNFIFNFVEKQTPGYTVENGKVFHVWNRIIDPRNMSFLHISKKIKMIPEPYLGQILFWESLGLPDFLPLVDHSDEIKNISTAPEFAGFVSTDITAIGNSVPQFLVPPEKLQENTFLLYRNYSNSTAPESHTLISADIASTESSVPQVLIPPGKFEENTLLAYHNNYNSIVPESGLVSTDITAPEIHVPQILVPPGNLEENTFFAYSNYSNSWNQTPNNTSPIESREIKPTKLTTKISLKSIPNLWIAQDFEMPPTKPTTQKPQGTEPPARTGALRPSTTSSSIFSFFGLVPSNSSAPIGVSIPIISEQRKGLVRFNLTNGHLRPPSNAVASNEGRINSRSGADEIMITSGSHKYRG